MSKKAPSSRGLDTSSDLFLVPKKNIIELLDIALCVRCCTGGPLPPREEDPPRNSAKRDRHKKILPRVTSTAHPVLTAVQPARRRDHTKVKAANRVLGKSWPTCSLSAVTL